MSAHPPPFTSRAVRATRESASLRVTIPQVIATTLGLGPGDELLWVVDPHTGVVHVERNPNRPSRPAGDPRAAEEGEYVTPVDRGAEVDAADPAPPPE